ncbi:YggS family pyridoxal phosphate-dependent enzyme [Fundidesulfovibrio soli]|uniref:YggS family pyridoxal phosphate-dependent enzyme n=1 Tax=Fundidesulfovibrio soli TaxID=2922716 RepID=UPI001FAED4A7|nr:YggS family pyridoxal phosphate-dependent enzyme [Fundidesulfovibrio soli]
MQDAMTPRQRLDAVRERIARACARCGRKPAEVTLVAVSKTHPAEDVLALHAAGQDLFGESYVQEALPKMAELAGQAREGRTLAWHFIGRLQKNKVKYIAGKFALLHTIDSLELASIVHKKSAALGLVQPVLLQVNLAHEEQKAGCEPGDAEGLARAIMGMEGLRLDGLMLMPPWDPDPEANRGLFAQARQLRDTLARNLGLALPELSMGMSHDVEQAVEEGATLVRVGTDLFGQRPCAR